MDACRSRAAQCSTDAAYDTCDAFSFHPRHKKIVEVKLVSPWPRDRRDDDRFYIVVLIVLEGAVSQQELI